MSSSGALALTAVLAVVLWLRPHPADDGAVAATVPSSTVDVVSTPTAWELRPTRTEGAGVVFFPGALVDPRAYLALLRPLAEQGHLVVVVKPPLGVALLASARPALDAHGATTSWAVGGHSLGGVAAASVFGENDGLSTPADIDASRDRLPPSTVFTEVPGAVHAFFGDYGPQAGDGTPTTDRATAQRLIVAATAGFVDGL